MKKPLFFSLLFIICSITLSVCLSHSSYVYLICTTMGIIFLLMSFLSSVDCIMECSETSNSSDAKIHVLNPKVTGYLLAAALQLATAFVFSL